MTCLEDNFLKPSVKNESDSKKQSSTDVWVMKLESKIIAKTYKTVWCFCFPVALLIFSYYSMQLLGSDLLYGRCPASCFGQAVSSSVLGTKEVMGSMNRGNAGDSETGVLWLKWHLVFETQPSQWRIHVLTSATVMQ